MEAQLLQEEVLKSVEGTDSRAVELIKNNLALTFWNQGRLKEAEELFVQVMETRKRVHGQEHPHTLTSMASLASTFWSQERWKEAEELEVQVMMTKKRVLGREHPSTLTSMTNLATKYMSQGRRTEAKGLQIKGANQLQATIGKDHPSTVAAIANLASFREERTPPAPFCGASDLIELLRDRILQFAASFHATSIEPDERNETDEERLQRALDMPMMNENGCEEMVASKENIRLI